VDISTVIAEGLKFLQDNPIAIETKGGVE